MQDEKKIQIIATGIFFIIFQVDMHIRLSS